MAPRVARQLIFARGWEAVTVEASVTRLDALVQAAWRGDAKAERALRELARLTRELEALQGRRRLESASQEQRAMEAVRRKLAAQLLSWAE